MSPQSPYPAGGAIPLAFLVAAAVVRVAHAILGRVLDATSTPIRRSLNPQILTFDHGH
jgi:hypothetical protein